MTNIQLTVFGVNKTVISTDDLPREIAKIFAQMDDKNQAKFWDCLSLETSRWEKPDCFQWAMVEPFLTDRARNQIRKIAEYTDKQSEIIGYEE